MAGERKMHEVTHDWAGDMWDWPLQHDGFNTKVSNTPEGFKVELKVTEFNPNEVRVSTVLADGIHEVMIDCYHEHKPKEAEWNITRHVQRNYRLPADVDVSTLKSHMVKDHLIITASKKK